MMIQWHLCLYLFFILLICQSSGVYSIQCCRDSICSAETYVDCPSNICFKLVFSKLAEDRGCMDDLINLLKFHNMPGQNLNDDNGDHCQKMDGMGGGISLCKCTSNLCNSSSKYSYFSFPVLILIFFVVYQFPCVFL